MGCAPTSSGDRPPRPLRDLLDHARAAGRGMAHAGGALAGRVPFWRLYGRFLETGAGQLFLDRGKILGAGAARLVVPAVDADIPWARFAGPLRAARVALVSTGGLYLPPDPPFDVDAPRGDPSLRVIPSGTPLTELRIAHSHYGHQRADRDRNVVFPLDRLRELAAAGFIGSLGPRAYSFGFTMHTGELIDSAGSARELARLLAEDGVDAILFAPAWPVCNRTVGLVARVVEASGIPTVALSVNRGYSERVRAPRTVFLNFPYGSVFGEPGDGERQRAVLVEMLRMLEDADRPGLIVDLPFRWRR